MRKKADVQTLKCFSIEFCSKIGRAIKRKPLKVWGTASGFMTISESMEIFFIANRQGEPVYTLDTVFYHSSIVCAETALDPLPENVIEM